MLLRLLFLLMGIHFQNRHTDLLTRTALYRVRSRLRRTGICPLVRAFIVCCKFFFTVAENQKPKWDGVVKVDGVFPTPQKRIWARQVSVRGRTLCVNWCVSLSRAGGRGWSCHYFEQLDFFKTAAVSNHIQKTQLMTGIVGERMSCIWVLKEKIFFQITGVGLRLTAIFDGLSVNWKTN